MNEIKTQYALISVFDKTGVEEIAAQLVDRGFALLGTGNTRKQLIEKGFDVTEVAELTGEPERFGGRVKTLHHKILGALLMRSGQDETEWPFDFRISAVVCNFYPFREKAAGCKDIAELMEWVDIGGPTMVRAAAKSHKDVWVFTHPNQYSRFEKIEKEQESQFRLELAWEAFELVRELDSEISHTLFQKHLSEEKNLSLKYGENPHQKARFIPRREDPCLFLGNLSFNNLRDSEAALRFVRPFGGPAVSVVKHQTLCGASFVHSDFSDDAQNRAFNLAWEGDITSRFGSIIAFNYLPTKTVTETLLKKFIEVLIVPDSEQARVWAADFRTQKERVRIILVPEKAFKHYPSHEESFGGYLGQIAQESDQLVNAEVDSLSKFGQWCGTCTKSNAIVLVGSDESTQTYYFAGAGQGQPNRVEALEHLAIPRAKDFCQRMDFSWESLACFSDAFIPFRDTVDILAKSGLKTLYQPGGSKADDEIKSVAEELGVTMHLTGERHFWH